MVQVYNIVATVEAPSSVYLGTFACRARDTLQEMITIPLPG